MTDDSTESHDLILETLWKRVTDAWDDDKAHAAVLDYAVRKKRLPDLAAKYRQYRDDTTRGPLAKKKLDGIVVAATAMMETMRTPRPKKTPWWANMIAGLVCALMLGWLAYMILKR